MKTIKERFAAFRSSSKANAIKYGRITDWEKKYKADLAFFQQELLSLAETAEQIRKDSDDMGASEIVELIKTKAADLLDK